MDLDDNSALSCLGLWKVICSSEKRCGGDSALEDMGWIQDELCGFDHCHPSSNPQSETQADQILDHNNADYELTDVHNMSFWCQVRESWQPGMSVHTKPVSTL